MTPLRAGIIAAVATLVADQASKLWLLKVFDLAHRGIVKVTPFFDLWLAWNIGISFGWLQNDGQAAQLALMAVKVIAVKLCPAAKVNPSTSTRSVPPRSTLPVVTSVAYWPLAVPCTPRVSDPELV